MSPQLPHKAQHEGVALPERHLREQDPEEGGGLPEGDLEQGRAAGEGEGQSGRLAMAEDIVSHMRASDARYHATIPAEFLDRNPPPMFITLYFIVTRLPDSLRSVRDHFLSLDPTSLTVDLLEEHLLAAETSAVATSLMLRTSELLLLVRSAAAARARVVEVVEGAAGVVVGAAVEVVEAVEVVAVVGLVAGVGALAAAVEAAVGVAAMAAVGLVAIGLELGVVVPEVACGSRSSVRARPSRPSSFTCGRLHTHQRCFSRLDDAWRAEFGDEVDRPCWADLLRSGVAFFDLDFDVILSAMYALSVSAEGDCYWCVPYDLGLAAAALGASESGTLPGTALAEALHTFTLDSGASRSFFRDSTTLTPLSAPVPVRLADPSGGPVVVRSSTVLPCPAVLSGSLSGLHLPSFSTNLVSTAGLQDAMVTTTTPGGSILYTLATEPPHVAASAQVSAPGQVAPPCSCRLLSHQTRLWHHRLGHPSLPRSLVGQGRVCTHRLPSLLRLFSSTTALVTPPCHACVACTAVSLSLVFPGLCLPSRPRLLRPVFLALRGGSVLLLTPRFPRLLLHERFRADLLVLHLHSDRGGEFSSDLLRDFCRGEGILQSFTLPDSPQQNGIAERRIGLVMEVARTSMIHAAAPHFLWSFAVWYGAHQLNLWPRVFSPTLRWTGKVGDASVFRDVMFHKSVPFYRLFPYRSAPLPPLPLFLAPGPPPVDPLPPQGLAPSGVSQVDPPLGVVPGEVAIDSGAARGTASGGTEPEGAEPGGAETGGSEPKGTETRGAETGGAEPSGAEPEGVEPGGAESEGAESGGAEPQGAPSSVGSAGASPRLSPQQLCEWLVRRARLWSGATGAGGAGAAGAGGGGVSAGAGVPGGTSATGPGGARTRGTGAAGTGGVGGAGAGDPAESGAARAGGSGAGGAGAGGAGAGGAGAVDPGGTPASPQPAPSPYTEQTEGLTEYREPASRPASPVRTSRRIPRPLPLPAPLESSLPEVLDPESDCARATSPTVSHLLATSVIDPSFESVAELLDSTTACRLDFATALVAESASASPPSVGGEFALGTDVLEDRQEDFEFLAAAVPRFASMLLAPEGDPDAPDITTPRS
ncbi:unnamed protein product [Closterium sp. NIES-53]